MYCEKCGNEINDGDTFCSKCGNKIEDIKNRQENKEQNRKKSSKINKKMICVIVGIIIVIIIAVVGIILGTNKNKNKNKNKDTINNENVSIEENSNSQSEIQDFKYVQKDDNSPVGYSFTNIDFELFKDNVRRVWFKEALEFDSIMEVNKSKFGNNYSKWVEGHTQDNYPSEEIVTYYTTTGTINGPYSISKSVIILYNKTKTNVVGVRVHISDKYLGKMGRSKEMEYINEVIDCFPNDFKEEIYDRIEQNKYNGNDTDKEYFIQYGEEIINGENYIVLAIIQKTDGSVNNGEVLNNEQETNLSIENNTNNNVTTNAPSSNNNNSNTQTSTPSNSGNNKPQKEMVQVPWFSMGYELKQYTDDLDKLGIKYKVVKGQDLKYEDNTVIKVENNGEYVEKGTTITITVADNIYNAEVQMNTEFLLEKAGFYEDNFPNEVSISIKVNGTTICNGKYPATRYFEKCGTYKGKVNNLKVEAVVEGKSITLRENKDFHFVNDEYETTITINNFDNLG